MLYGTPTGRPGPRLRTPFSLSPLPLPSSSLSPPSPPSRAFRSFFPSIRSLRVARPARCGRTFTAGRVPLRGKGIGSKQDAAQHDCLSYQPPCLIHTPECLVRSRFVRSRPGTFAIIYCAPVSAPASTSAHGNEIEITSTSAQHDACAALHRGIGSAGQVLEQKLPLQQLVRERRLLLVGHR